MLLRLKHSVRSSLPVLRYHVHNYTQYLSPHITKILSNKPELASKCEPIFNKIIRSSSAQPQPSSSSSTKDTTPTNTTTTIQTTRTKLNIIFNIYTLGPILQPYKQQLAQMVAKGQIKTQSEVDKVTGLLVRKMKGNRGVTLGEVLGMMEGEQRERREFERELEGSAGGWDVGVMAKVMREKYLALDSKYIYERLKAVSVSASSSASSSSVPTPSSPPASTTPFHLKLPNLKPRLLPHQCNTPALHSLHLSATSSRPHFRFPPQPNGYLHIGHIKSIRLNFQTAIKTNGVCILRYDDTNPQTETQEYIRTIRESVEWLGYRPERVTYASDYFGEMMEMAIRLIKQGDAYVCDSSQAQIEQQRQLKQANPYRNRPIQQSLACFPSLAPSQTLRLKLDPASPNPTLRDPIIYRLKSHPHPRTGTRFKVYPMYDFAHCICDSLQNIDYSLCSLQFEIRRELYYKILDLLGLYKPIVWQYSRLNIQGSLLSKRKIKALIQSKQIQNWDDARLLTIKGLANRGYTPGMLLNFIDKVNASRNGNENVVQYGLLEREMRRELYKRAEKSMMVLKGRRVRVQGLEGVEKFKVGLWTEKKEITVGEKTEREITLTSQIFLQQSDCLALSLGQKLVLKYAGVFQVTQLTPELTFHKLPLTVPQLKSLHTPTPKILHWISPADSTSITTTLYDRLLTQQQKLNPNSKQVYEGCLVTREVAEARGESGRYWQMERLGYFKFDGRGQFIRCTTLV